MDAWLPMLATASQMFLFLAIELSILFIAISIGVNLLRKKIPDHKIQAILGAKKGKGYVVATLLGAITPFCSCSTIPMLRGLLSAKAGFGPTLTFLFISPLLNPIIIGLMWVTFGLKITLIYMTIATTVSIVASILLNRLGFERYIINNDAGNCSTSSTKTNSCSKERTNASITSSSCCSPSPVKPALIEENKTSCCTDKTDPSAKLTTINSSIQLATKEAWQQFKIVLPYLFFGVLVGSLIYGFMPSEWIASHAGANKPWAIPLSAVIGIPLYIRAEAVIPLASVLMAKGMNIGPVMALIIGSAGASLTEVILLKSMFKLPMIIAFITVILSMAITMGYLTQFLGI